MRDPSSMTRSCRARANVDLPLPESPVKKTTRPRSSGPGWSSRTTAAIRVGTLVALARPLLHQHPVGGGVGAADVLLKPAIEYGVAVVGEGARDDVDLDAVPGEQLGGDQARAHEADRRDAARSALPDEGEEQHLALVRDDPDLLEVPLGGRARDADDQAFAVATYRLRGGEVQPAERAVLGAAQRCQGAVGRQPGQRQSLGVDQLDLVGITQCGRQRRGDLVVEAGARGERAGEEELQVVELTRSRTVLLHRVMLSDAVAPVATGTAERALAAGRAARDPPGCARAGRARG